VEGGQRQGAPDIRLQWVTADWSDWTCLCC
jgi:hypothetical protein